MNRTRRVMQTKSPRGPGFLTNSLSGGRIVARTALSSTLLLLVLLLLAAPGIAQVQVGSIAGVVKDATGGVLPDTKVTLSSSALLGGARTVTTDENGYFKFLELRPGTYTLKFERQGFKSLTWPEVVITSVFEAKLNVQMRVGDLTESIIVAEQAPTIDTSNVVNQTVAGQEILEKIPTPRDPWVLGRLVPGVQAGQYDVGGTQGMQQYALTIHGSRDSDKKFAIDGAEINWPGGTGGATAIYYDAGMFQEVNYQVGALPAEISQGGVYMNMVTKDGGNAIHGTVLFYGSSEGMQSDNVDPALKAQLLAGVPGSLRNDPNLRAGNPIRHIYDSNANVGGAIKKDKVWWFGSYRQWSVDQLVSGAFNPDGTQAIDDNLIRSEMGKISWQVNAKNKLSALYSRNQKNRFHRRDTPPFFVEDKASVLQDQPGYNTNVKWVFTPSSRWALDSSAALTHIIFPLRYQPSVTPSDITKRDLTLSTRTGAAANNYVNPNYRFSVDSSASRLASGLGGTHNFKFGVQFSRSFFRQIYNANGDIEWQFDNGTGVSVLAYNTPLDQRNYLHQFAWFAQDSWTLRQRLTLNVGLRFEYILGVIPAQSAPAGTFVGARSSPEIRNVPNFKNWSPRIGLSWDVRGRGKTVIKASASRYLQNFGMSIPTAVNPLAFSTDSRPWNDADRDGIPQPNEIGPGQGFIGGATSRLDPNLERPYSWEYSLGVEQEVFGGVVVSFTGWHRDTRRQIGRANQLVPPTAYLPVVINNPLTNQPFTVYNQDPATRGKVDNLIMNFASLDAEYNGLDLNFRKRFAQRWQLLGGLTIGRDRGPLRGDLITGFDDLNNPNLAPNRFGIVGNDATHQFKLAGTYELPWGIELSGNFQHATGYPLRRILVVTRVQVPGLTQGTQAIDLVPRGPIRLPSVNLLDLRLSKIIRIRERWRIRPTLDIYNVANVNTVTQQVESVSSTGATGRPAVIISPRLFKLGAKVDF